MKTEFDVEKGLEYYESRTNFEEIKDFLHFMTTMLNRKSKDGRLVSNEDYALVLDSYLSKIED